MTWTVYTTFQPRGPAIIVSDVRYAELVAASQVASAVQSPVIDRSFESPWFDVTDFDAVAGTGNDNTAAFIAWHDALPTTGCVAFIPPGIYQLNPTSAKLVFSKPKVNYYGPGATIQVLAGSTTGNLWKMTGATDCTVEGITFDGNRANQAASGVNHYGLFGDTTTRLHVKNCKFNNFLGVGFQMYNSTDAMISQCSGGNNLYHTFECEQTTNSTWTQCVGHHNGANGFFLSPGEVGGSGSSRNVITNCSFHDNTNYGWAVGTDAQNLSDYLSSDNTFVGNICYNNGDYGASLFRQNKTTVIGDTYRNNGLTGLHLQNSGENVISGCRFETNSQRQAGWQELHFEQNDTNHKSENNTVIGNIFRGGGPHPANYGIKDDSGTITNTTFGNRFFGTFANGQMTGTPTNVGGSRSGNAALDSLLSILAIQGIIQNGTTA